MTVTGDEKWVKNDNTAYRKSWMDAGKPAESAAESAAESVAKPKRFLI